MYPRASRVQTSLTLNQTFDFRPEMKCGEIFLSIIRSHIIKGADKENIGSTPGRTHAKMHSASK